MTSDIPPAMEPPSKKQFAATANGFLGDQTGADDEGKDENEVENDDINELFPDSRVISLSRFGDMADDPEYTEAQQISDPERGNPTKFHATLEPDISSDDFAMDPEPEIEDSSSTASDSKEEPFQYAQVTGRTKQTARFTTRGRNIADLGGVSNRDVLELMSRDTQISGGAIPQPTSQPSSPPEGPPEVLKPIAVIPDAFPRPGEIYGPLPLDGQFRLLEILPGTDDAPLDCRLQICSVSDNRNAYEALSYTWKTENEANAYTVADSHKTVQCNGVEMRVGGNLHMALRRLRCAGRIRVIWADAICINQKDIEERGYQVAAMGDIFRNAHSVLVWLGPDEDSADDIDAASRNSARAFAGVCSIVSTWASLTEKHTNMRDLPRYRIRGSEEEFSGSSDQTLSEDSDTWSMVVDLIYNKRWFRRLWVVQEIALAQRATIIWGDCEISWSWIGLAAAVIRTNWNIVMSDIQGVTPRTSRRIVPVGVMNAYFMYRISPFQKYFEPLRFSFCELLVLTRQFQCEDDRDKVFGLLGLTTTDDVNASIVADYTRPLEEVYRAIISAMLRCSKQPLDFLSHVHHTPALRSQQQLIRPEVQQLPSWVPRWNIVGPQTLRPLEPSWRFAAGLKRPPQFRGQPDRLAVWGVVLDKVHVMTLEWARGDFDSQRKTRQNNIDATLAELLSKHTHTRSELKKLAMTLVAGKSWYGTPVTDRSAALADLADCLLTGRFWWTLEEGAFGHLWKPTRKEGTATSTALGNRNNGKRNPTGEDEGEVITLQALKKLSEGGNGNLFIDAVATACGGRRRFTTSTGMRGVGPREMKLGDKVCVIQGTQMPFIIRWCDEKEGYTLVGECYIEDLMDGWALKKARDEKGWIELV
ncbi:heterokaryon incompatibility protein-domain-containing protein [Podospora didyma]|uniref:Heterokaryon incompatibility protein-domain-containing protein n=1 Tax=Podospora didyma TaxID=330526 RepID=A0AAE0N3C8_9PEZI|nr:heterokaryon incompatibility protein-domain-containing protein [Podospora didyma]